MRGYADDLRASGWTVDYDAERNAFETPLAEHIARFRSARASAASPQKRLRGDPSTSSG
jgi:deoxyribodipyrimidine photolyase-like uncharacterized protein